MKPNTNYSHPCQSGFTLVEIMVGLVIGLLATLVITQVLSVFEAQKRGTTGTADAQTNGSIALYKIERELKMAGYSMMPTTIPALACTALYIDGALQPDVSNLSPVTITDGNSDTITLRYGNSNSGGTFTPISITGNPGANDITVGSNLGCRTGDTTLIINNTTCAMSSASAVPAIGTLAGTSAVQTSITLNKLLNPGAPPVGANIACLGNWIVNTYSVNNVTNNLQLNTVPSMEGIVNIQAQYGISAQPSLTPIIAWVDPVGPWAAGALTPATRNQIKAVRIAVVARNPKIDKDNVTDVCSSLTTAAPTGLCAWEGNATSPAPAITLNNDPNGTSWQRYRYRVFETIIPLRNMIWASKVLKP